jgi:hypothetical protein
MTQSLKAPRELTLLPNALNTQFQGTGHEQAACGEGPRPFAIYEVDCIGPTISIRADSHDRPLIMREILR